MKQRIILIYLLVFLLSISFAFALSVELVSPQNTAYIYSNAVYFKCKAIGKELIQLQLYTDTSGTWGQTSVHQNPANDTEVTFNIQNINNGNYKWNCKIISGIPPYGAWASSNRTFTIEFSNSPPTLLSAISNQTWNKDTSLSNVINLGTHFSDPEGKTLTYSVSGNSNINIQINSENKVSFSQASGWWGVDEKVTFKACDPDGKCTNSNQVTLTVSQTTCTDTSWSPDPSTVTCDQSFTQTSNCGNTRTSTGTKDCAQCEEDWECTDWSSCSDGTQTRTCTDNNGCGTEEDKPSTSKSCSVPDSELYSLEITSSNPTSSTVTMNKGASKTFMIDTNLLAVDTEWYVDDKLQKEISDAFRYTPAASDIGTHTIKVIVKKGTDVDAKEWTVTVVEPVPIAVVSTNKCGNNQTDVNETCLSCPQDIPCKENEVCDEGICKERQSSFIESITGYTTKIKDSLIDRWYYSLAVLVLVLLVIFVLSYQKVKSKKSKPLAEFEEKKPLLGRIRKSLRDWDKNRQQKKENKVQVKQLEKERKQEIKESVPTDLNPIISFINESKTRGYSNWQIVKALKNKGWSRMHIRQAFTQLNDSRKEAKGN